MTNLDSVLKSRDITLPRKVCLVKALVFPVVMYGCECWTIKKAERQRIDASELWCCRWLLKVPWTTRRSNQTILKEISPEYSLEGLMLKLKLQYFGHLMRRTDSLEKTLMLGKIWGRRRRGGQRMRWFGWHHWLNGHEFEQAPGNGEGQGSLVCCSPWDHKELDTTEQLNNEFLMEFLNIESIFYRNSLSEWKTHNSSEFGIRNRWGKRILGKAKNRPRNRSIQRVIYIGKVRSIFKVLAYGFIKSVWQ